MTNLHIAIGLIVVLVIGVLLFRRDAILPTKHDTMTVTITSLDGGPDDLIGQLPVSAKILRMIPGIDRPDYFLAELSRPVSWTHDGQQTQITHLIVGAYLAGDSLQPGRRGIGLQIAYVTDSSLLADARLEFSKCYHCAIGFADIT